jgi:SAM-dependent methyltransferase
VTGRWGAHEEFAELYESSYLGAVYPPSHSGRGPSERQQLVTAIDKELRDRGAWRILDCAAGTGFPSLDLAAEAGEAYRIRCSDGDRAMLTVFAQRARELSVPLERVLPRRWPSVPQLDGLDGLHLDWMQLGHIRGQFDYVLCRGNSLAYADTWTGARRVASMTVLGTFLDRMASKIRPGGYLHVDAPWTLDLPTTNHRTLDGPFGTIWEQVTALDDCREWWVSFKPVTGGPPVEFKRYSSLLTIDRVQRTLEWLGFEETTPFQMAGERPNFATIVARKPNKRYVALETVGRHL